MKTAEQIAEEVLKSHSMRDHWVRTTGQIRAFLVEAVELARSDYSMIDSIASVLDDRDAPEAAALVRDTDPDDDLWNNYVGPMIDEIQEDYTAMALAMAEEEEWG
jgi:hypothetical protein